MVAPTHKGHCSDCGHWKWITARQMCNPCYHRWLRRQQLSLPNPNPEIERRIVLYAERAARREPLFGRDRKDR
jgi:hypothetical protein